MKKILKDLLDSKQKLFDIQKVFVKALDKRYPNLMKMDVDTLEREINNELDFLLSSALRIKSGRILISALRNSWNKEVVLTRNPGLKRPHAFGRDILFTEVNKIDANGDLEMGEPEDFRYSVKMSILADSNIILQDKLKVFYVFLRNAINWKGDTEDFIVQRYHCPDKSLTLGRNSKAQIYSKDFSLRIYDSASRDYDQIEASKIQDFESGVREEKLYYQNILSKVLEDFDNIDKALLAIELRKKNLINLGKELLKKLKETNRPTRVFHKLLKS